MENQNCWWAGTGRWRRVPPIALVYPRSSDSGHTPLTVTGLTIGTLQYMAPERFAGHDVDGRTDVYSLACVLHECLTGAPPFGGKELPALIAAQLYSVPPQASSLVEGVPSALDAVIARGMAKDPKDRFPTAGMLAAAAREALLTGTPTPSVPELHHPTRQAAAAVAARPGVAEPPGPEAEPAGDRSAAGVRYSATQTRIADRVDQRSDLRPPDLPQQGAGLLEPADGTRLPPGGATGRPARGPAWRRLSVLIPALVVALAVPIVVVLIGSARPNAARNAGDATRTGTAGVASSAPRLAVPTVAGEVPVGQTPSYIQVAPNGKFAYITNQGAGEITVLNTANDTVSGTIPIPQGPPQSVSFSLDGRTAYVSVYNTRGSVHLIVFVDTATRKVTGTVTVNNHEPGPSTPSPDGPYLYVPNHNMVMGGPGDDVIDVIDTASKLLVDSIPVAANPHWVAFSKNGQLIYATNHMSAKLTILNPRTNTIIKAITVGETPHSEALSPLTPPFSCCWDWVWPTVPRSGWRWPPRSRGRWWCGGSAKASAVC